MIDIIQGFRPGSAEPIDNRLVLSKQEMLNVNDKIMPESYFAVCVDDGILYSYDKKNTPNSATGKFVAVTDFIYDVTVNNESVSYIENNKKLANIDLTSYSKSNEVAYTISLELDDEYKLKSILKNKAGLEISSSEVDFPIETLISAISYDASSKSIKFTLESGLEKTVSLSNLVTDTFVAATYATKTELFGKVDKEDGKALSTNDLTNLLKSNYDTAYNHSQSLHARTDATKTEASSNNGYIKINGEDVKVYTHPSGTNPHGLTASDIGLGNVDNTSDINKPISNAVSEALSKKVDKIDNKVLTSNDFTNSYKEKLDSIAQGANVNVQADWNINVDTDDSFIKNKPTKLSQFTNDTNYATESFVREQGGKIDVIKVNGDEQPITNKKVDIQVPTKTSDLINDKNYISKAVLSADIITEVAIGNIAAGKKLKAGTSIESILKSMFTTYVPPMEGIRVGSVQNLSKSQFKALTDDELVAASESESTENLPFSWNPSSVKEIFFIMLRDDLSFGAGSAANLISGGLVTSFSASDITSAGGSWQNTASGNGHEDVVVDGETYHVYSYYSGSWNIGSDVLNILSIKEND